MATKTKATKKKSSNWKGGSFKAAVGLLVKKQATKAKKRAVKAVKRQAKKVIGL